MVLIISQILLSLLFIEHRQTIHLLFSQLSELMLFLLIPGMPISPFLVESFWLFIPWLTLILIFKVFLTLCYWAKNRKTGVAVLAVFIQMFLPDPYVEKTIKTVQVAKEKKTKKQPQNNSDGDIN